MSRAQMEANIRLTTCGVCQNEETNASTSVNYDVKQRKKNAAKIS